MKQFWKHIEIKPEKRNGQPCIKGTRITVNDIIGYLVSGMTIDQIIDDFPSLSSADITAAQAYSNEHRIMDT